jgi:hypothetical protein
MADTPRLVVREVSRGRQWLWIILATAVFGSASYGLYIFLRSQLPYDWAQVELERERMAAQRSELNREINRLREENGLQAEQIVMLQRGVDIDRESTAELKTALRDLQSELEAQKEQLAFYRGIVSPDESRAGMRIYELRVSAVQDQPLQYSFDLMLIQAVRHSRRVSGQIKMVVVGVQDGEERSLSAEKIQLQNTSNMQFAFRYFQELHGSFTLPEGFAPTSVTLKVKGLSNSADDFERNIPWAEVRKEAGA